MCRQPGAESSEAAKSEDMANGASSAGAAEHAPSGGSSLLEALSFHALESRNDGAPWRARLRALVRQRLIRQQARQRRAAPAARAAAEAVAGPEFTSGS